jgi:hypothetical protein
VTEDGRIVGGEKWQEKVYNREEWKKLLIVAFCTCQWNECNFPNFLQFCSIPEAK